LKKQIKFLLFTLLIILPFYSNSQEANIEINGLILDQSNNPVPYVAVGIVKKYIGIASTEDGEFSFLVSKNELQDSLSISSLGFDPFKIKVADYLKLKKKEIVLIETVTELDEITLLQSGDYVVKALKMLKENTISTPHQIEFLYRSAVTEGDQPKLLVENYIKVKDRGPAYYFGEVQVTESRKSADYRIWKPNTHWHPINVVAHVNPIRPNDSGHSRNIKKFIWKKTGDSSYEGEDVVILEGTNPDKQWEKIKLYIGLDTYKIYRIERGSTLFIYKNHESGKLVLSYYNHDWHLSKDRIPKEYWNTPVVNSHFKAEAFVYKIITDKKEIKVIPYGINVDAQMIDLPYNAEFWKHLSSPPDTKFYKNIKDGLEALYGVPLEKQYELVNE
jgi:hypothetical protein